MATLKDYIADGLKKGYSKNELTKILLDKGYARKEIDSLFDEPKQATRKATSTEIGFFERIGLLIAHPNRFFEEIRDEHIGNAIGLFALAAAVALAGTIALAVIGRSMQMYSYSGVLLSGALVWMVGIYIVVGFISSFVYSGLLHGCAKMFGGNGNWVDTYNALAYSAAPSVVLSMIPLVGGLAGIYSLVLLVIGLSKYHQISIGKAIGTVLIPLAVIAAILIGLLFWALATIHF